MSILHPLFHEIYMLGPQLSTHFTPACSLYHGSRLVWKSGDNLSDCLHRGRLYENDFRAASSWTNCGYEWKRSSYNSWHQH